MKKKIIKKTKKELNIRPIGDRVVIKPESESTGEKKSASGIIIPVTEGGDRSDRGVVVAVGEGRIDNDGNLIPMNVKVGNKVIFQYGDKITLDGEEYFVVNESNVLAIIR